MTDKSQLPKGREGVLSLLNVAINGLNLAKEASSTTPATAVFGSVAVILAMIRVSFSPLFDGRYLVHTWPGHDGQRTGLC